MRISRRGVLAATGLLAPGRAQAADEGVSYPFVLTRNMAWAAAQLNDKNPPLPFMIDTGSSGFAVLQSKAEALGLYRLDRTTAQAAAGRTSVVIYEADIVLGGVVRENKLPIAGFKTIGPKVEGLIPLARFRVMGMDFDRHEVLITSRMPKDLEGYQPLGLDAGRAADGSVDPLGAYSNDDNNQLIKDHRPVIEAEFDGERVKLMVDSGSSDGLFLFPDYVKRKGLWDHYGKALSEQGETLARTVTTRLVRAQSLKIGKLVFANPIVSLGNPADSDQSGSPAQAGLIGMEFLRRLNFISDPQRRRLWIKPNGAIGDGYRYDRAGADVEWVGGVARVVMLAPGAPADRAGLKLGDKVSGWRGRDGIEGLSWALKGAPGSTVEIQVERGGAAQMVTVVLEERV